MPLFLKRISSLAILSTSSELRAAPDTAAHRRKVDAPRPVLRWQIVESQRRQAIADGDVRVRRFIRGSEKCRERGHAARRGPGQRRVGAQLRRAQGARHEPLERGNAIPSRFRSLLATPTSKRSLPRPACSKNAAASLASWAPSGPSTSAKKSAKLRTAAMSRNEAKIDARAQRAVRLESLRRRARRDA